MVFRRTPGATSSNDGGEPCRRRAAISVLGLRRADVLGDSSNRGPTTGRPGSTYLLTRGAHHQMRDNPELLTRGDYVEPLGDPRTAISWSSGRIETSPDSQVEATNSIRRSKETCGATASLEGPAARNSTSSRSGRAGDDRPADVRRSTRRDRPYREISLEYAVMLTGGWNVLEPVIEDDWKVIFRGPAFHRRADAPNRLDPRRARRGVKGPAVRDRDARADRTVARPSKAVGESSYWVDKTLYFGMVESFALHARSLQPFSTRADHPKETRPTDYIPGWRAPGKWNGFDQDRTRLHREIMHLNVVDRRKRAGGTLAGSRKRRTTSSGRSSTT